MKTSRSLFVAILLAFCAFTFTSCDKKDPIIEEQEPEGAYAQDAVLISNEGNFGSSNGSVSYYNRSTGAVENNIFSKENDRILGDVVQHVSVHGDRAFLVVNNSRKIEVVNANTFKEVGVINGLELPRYFTALNENKGYATEWVSFSGNGRVAVIDLKTYTVTKTIEVGVLPERLVIANGKLYVANSSGNTISVINTATDALETSIPVTHGPNSLEVDRNNNLWVVSGGMKVYNADWSLNATLSTPGALTKISNTIVLNTLPFASSSASAGKLSINANKDKLYYSYAGKVYQHDVNATALNTTAIINRNFYGMGVDPKSDYIYGSDNKGFQADGWVIRYQTTGAKVDSFKVGVGPNGFSFR